MHKKTFPKLHVLDTFYLYLFGQDLDTWPHAPCTMEPWCRQGWEGIAFIIGSICSTLEDHFTLEDRRIREGGKTGTLWFSILRCPWQPFLYSLSVWHA
jgi:hypothetical protein